MNEAIEPSFCARFLARLLAIGQLLVLGPITFASTLLSSFLCCCCIYVKLRSDKKDINCSVIQETFNVCMSSWGIIWMILLFVLPIGLALGSVVGSIAFALVVISYPCYASYRYVFELFCFFLYCLLCCYVLLHALLPSTDSLTAICIDLIQSIAHSIHRECISLSFPFYFPSFSSAVTCSLLSPSISFCNIFCPSRVWRV
jgi:hypothetical protein